jgi:signal transduction histidine kinase
VVQRRIPSWSAVARIGPRLRDVLFIVLSLAWTLLIVTEDEPGALSPWVTALIGIVCSSVLWLRRKYPVAVTVIALIGQFLTWILPPLGFGLLTLAVRRRTTVLLVMALLGYAAYVIPAAIDKPSDLPVLLITGPFVLGTFVAVGAYTGTRRDLVESLRDRAERAEAERELRAEQARLGERARIAQEMHDVLAHKVSLIALHAGGLEVNPAKEPATVERAAGVIRETARQAMEDLREVLGVLRQDVSADGADLTPVPNAADLTRLVEASRHAGVSVRTEIMLPADLPETIGRTAYRIVQEGLTNVHKHARGAATDVLVRRDAVHGMTVRVTNVCPVAAGSLLPGAGAGLVGLRERVGLAGGVLTAGPVSDGGWRLEARLPWPGAHPGTEADPDADLHAGPDADRDGGRM